MRTPWITCPTTNISASSPIPSSVARSITRRASGGLVTKRSSPKFIEPVSTPARSGRASNPVIRSSIDIHTAPPVETMVTIGVRPPINAIASSNSPGRLLGEPSSSRTCKWQTEAPASAHAATSVAISAGVCASAGLSARVTSAPVGATVTTTGSSSHVTARSF